MRSDIAEAMLVFRVLALPESGPSQPQGKGTEATRERDWAGCGVAPAKVVGTKLMRRSNRLTLNS